ncbi:GGDEF domain-containing protein [Vagococcus xieshaowenii]|uniref:Diguanylate cyclase n=1 Tax=Vagococcus xieshaowenii TaxID=2562451 RepID=A0AAJ5JL05_9ENTE|nr:GGDEF domain-containing protein [Vagococcus xieshaowenii]QCA28017.1 diguanylate cyclase [Vagococcus xieshaowenii]TFZ40294.1 diguanylate cyclase [Vagococcus xieshaowenii]
MNSIETIISSVSVNISIIFSSILLMYFGILKKIILRPPVQLKQFNEMKMSRSTRIHSGIIFAIACYLLSINGIQIDQWQTVDTRYLLIYFVMYYASTLSGMVCGLLFMAIKSVVILLYGFPILSVEFLNNLFLTGATLIIAYFCTRNKSKTWLNNSIFLIILFIVRAVLIYNYIPYIDNQEWSPNLLAYYLITTGLFVIVFTLIKSSTQLINSIITYKLSAQIDSLTYLFNRSALLEHFDTILRRYLPNDKQPPYVISLGLIDLDIFKEINDEHGHAIGDQILAEFSNEMKEHFVTNFLYRFGGDEFVMMFIEDPSTVNSHVTQFITHVQAHIFLEKVKPMKLSISVGLTHAVLNEDLDLQSLLSQADDALYEAKDNGKNQLVTYNETMKLS